MRYQPSKLVMRVRFPSPAPVARSSGKAQLEPASGTGPRTRTVDGATNGPYLVSAGVGWSHLPELAYLVHTHVDRGARSRLVVPLLSALR